MGTWTEGFGTEFNPNRFSSMGQAPAQAERNSFSPAPILAGILDKHSGTSLRKILKTRQPSSLKEAVSFLPEAQGDRLKGNLTKSTWQKIYALASEEDSGFFYENLIGLGEKLAGEGSEELADTIFSAALVQLSKPSSDRPAHHKALLARTRSQMDLLYGGGPWQEKLNGMLSHFSDEVLNPISLASMVAGNLTYGLVRLGTFQWLDKSLRAAWWNRGLSAHALASTVGLGAEISAFVGAGRGLRELAGHQQDWSGAGLWAEWRSAALMLTGLKGSGAGTRFLMGKAPPRLSVVRNPGEWIKHRLPYVALPQMAMFGSIFGVHAAEASWGWRGHTDGASLFVESLATLIHFNFAGKMIEGGLGKPYARLNRKLNVEAEKLKRKLYDSVPKFPPGGVGQAWSDLSDLISQRAAAGVPFWVRIPRVPQSKIILNKMDGDNEAGGGSQIPPPSEPPEAPTLRKFPGPGKTKRGIGPGLKKAGPLAELEPEPQADLEDFTPNPPGSGTRPKHRDASPPPPAPENFGREVSLEGWGEAEGVGLKPTIDGKTPEGRALISSRLSEALADTTPPESEGPKDPMVGTVFGAGERYRVTKKIGQGGMGSVYEVHDSRLTRDVAMKVLSRAVDPDGHKIMRFMNEMRVQVHLDSRYTGEVYDQIELPGGQIGFLMKMIPGHDLDTVIWNVHRFPKKWAPHFSLDRIIDIFDKMAEGVHSSHAGRGVIHRDLKPANIRLKMDDPDNLEYQQVLVMDWGIAQVLGEVDAPQSRQSLPPRAREKIQGGLTQADILGTPGYMPSEALAPHAYETKFAVRRDVFASGVILYEMLTGIHPFSHFRKGKPESGEPELVPKENPETGYTEINMYGPLRMPYDMEASAEPPPLSKILGGKIDPILFELEKVALKAMALEPAGRYGSMEEMRQAVQMAKAHTEKAKYDRLGEKIRQGEQELIEISSDQRVPDELEEVMNAKENDLIVMKKAWVESARKLENYLYQITGKRPWPEAQRMIAEIAWERLLDEGDRITAEVREEIETIIIENDVTTADNPINAMALAIQGKISTRFSVQSILGDPIPEAEIQVRIIPLNREAENYNNYREGETIYQGNLEGLKGKVELAAGYYVIELEAPGFAPMRIPRHVRLEELRSLFETQKELEYDIEMVPESEVPEGMAVVHRTRATIGHDFYKDGNSSDNLSFPKREVEIPTILVSKDPVSVAEYLEFIRYKLSSMTNIESELPQIESWMPRTSQPHAGRTYYWKYHLEGEGRDRRVVLENPYEYEDPLGDPILPNQPISAIPARGAREYAKWRAEMSGRPNFLMPATLKEVISRNSFPWKSPWGYEQAKRSFVLSHRVLADKKRGATPYPIGFHPLGPPRDNSLYGNRELLGNVREFVAMPGTEDLVFLSGGSVRDIKGPMFLPSARNVMDDEMVLGCVGTFRLAMPLISKRPSHP